MAIYYVKNTGSDAADGLSDGNAWETIAKVNGESFSPGDNILFNKGDMWREGLAVPDSGSDGSPITIGSYGTGDDPVIKASDLVESLTPITSSPMTAKTTNGDLDQNAWENTRGVIPASALGVSATRIRIKIEASSTNTTYIDGMSIGERSGSTQNFVSTPTRVTFNTDDPDVTITAGNTVWSDWFDFDLDAAKDYLLQTYNDTGSQIRYTTGYDQGYKIVEENDMTMVTLATDGGAFGGVLMYVVEIESESGIYTKAGITTEPKIVFSDGVALTENDGATTGVGTGEWDWASDVLYINTGEDITGNVIEIGQRTYAILLFQMDWIEVENIHVTQSNQYGVQNQRGDDLVISNVLADYCYSSAIMSQGTVGDENDTILIEDCEVAYCSQHGVEISSYSHNVMIRRVVAHHCALDADANASGGGIYLSHIPGHAGTTWTNNIVEYCTVYSNGIPAVGKDAGTGIRYDEIEDGGGHFIRFNECYDNQGPGIWIEICVGATIICHHNISHDNVGDSTIDCGIGIRVGLENRGTRIYNNTLYGNRVNIYSGCYSGASGDRTFDDNLFKNNILYGAIEEELQAVYGGDNGANGSGNVYLNNCLGPEASNFIEWGDSNFLSTYDAWESAYGATTASVEADPKLVDVDSDDYHLLNDSPCSDAGLDVGLSEDFDGVGVSDPPSIGAYEIIISSVGIARGVPKNRLYLTNPGILQLSVFRGLLYLQPFIDIGGNGVMGLVRANRLQFRNNDTDVTWGYNEYGPTMVNNAGWIVTNVPSNRITMDSFTMVSWASTLSRSVERELLGGFYDNDNLFIRFGRQDNQPVIITKTADYAISTGVASGHNDGLIHMFGATSSPALLKMYYEGKEIASETGIDSATGTTEEFWIGNTSEDYGWVGDISFAAAWDRPLSPTEMDLLYKLGPALTLNTDNFPIEYRGAITAGALNFKVAWANNYNQVL